MNANTAPSRQAHRFLLLLGLLLLVSVLASLYFDIRNLSAKYQSLAAEMGRSFFQAIDTMRDWNLRHGGIYVQETEEIPPSTYMAEPLRSAVTTRGERLTLISHAHMTRLISELLTDQKGIHIHIASLRPIRPGNAADAWEQHALAHFERGSSEEYDVIGKGDSEVFKYMAPLRLKTSCLSCHQESGAPDSVRGGISVSFSYGPFQEALAGERQRMVLVHALFLILGFVLIALTGRKLVQSIEALQNSMLRIKRLEGLLPICAHCKKIRLQGADRTKPESWIAIEKYIADRTDAEFSHGMCPVCARQFYPEHFRGK